MLHIVISETGFHICKNMRFAGGGGGYSRRLVEYTTRMGKEKGVDCAVVIVCGSDDLLS